MGNRVELLFEQMELLVYKIMGAFMAAAVAAPAAD
jgi:hypothetical protein